MAENEGDIRGEVEDKLGPEHQNEEDSAGDEIVIVQAGRLKDVGVDTQEYFPLKRLSISASGCVLANAGPCEFAYG